MPLLLTHGVYSAEPVPSPATQTVVGESPFINVSLVSGTISPGNSVTFGVTYNDADGDLEDVTKRTVSWIHSYDGVGCAGDTLTCVIKSTPGIAGNSQTLSVYSYSAYPADPDKGIGTYKIEFPINNRYGLSPVATLGLANVNDYKRYCDNHGMQALTQDVFISALPELTFYDTAASGNNILVAGVDRVFNTRHTHLVMLKNSAEDHLVQIDITGPSGQIEPFDNRWGDPYTAFICMKK